MQDIYSFDKTKTVYDTRKFTPVPKHPHNGNIVRSAESMAKENRKNPSQLDKRMKELLDSWQVHYEYQKPVYVKSSGGFIKQYFIVGFFVPSRNIIIEVYSKPFQKTSQFVSRENAIKKAFPLHKRIEWYGKDFELIPSLKMLKDLVSGK